MLRNAIDGSRKQSSNRKYLKSLIGVSVGNRKEKKKEKKKEKMENL